MPTVPVLHWISGALLLLAAVAGNAGAQRAPFPAESLVFELAGRPHAVVDRTLRAAGFRTAGDPEEYTRESAAFSESIHIIYDRRRVYALTHSVTCAERAACASQFERRRDALRARLGVQPSEREPTMVLWYNVRGWSYMVDAPAVGEPLLVTSVSPGF